MIYHSHNSELSLARVQLFETKASQFIHWQVQVQGCDLGRGEGLLTLLHHIFILTKLIYQPGLKKSCHLHLHVIKDFLLTAQIIAAERDSCKLERQWPSTIQLWGRTLAKYHRLSEGEHAVGTVNLNVEVYSPETASPCRQIHTVIQRKQQFQAADG